MNKDLKISEEFPPNYEEIKAAFNLDGTKPLFTYGDTVYNPHKAELRHDLLIHEEVHSKQQADDPKGWWERYLTDKDFRFQQELDAYAVQFGYVKHLVVANKKTEWFLDRLAEILSSPMYGNLMSFHKARSKIRNREKEIYVEK